MKKEEIEHSKAKIHTLSALVQKYPDNKLYVLRYKIAYKRFKRLLKTSNALEHLQSEFY